MDRHVYNLLKGPCLNSQICDNNKRLITINKVVCCCFDCMIREKPLDFHGCMCEILAGKIILMKKMNDLIFY